MKKFLQQHGLWVLFATAVIAVTLAAMSFFSTTSSPLRNLAGVIVSPFRTAYTAAADWINDKKTYYADYKALEAENQRLRDQIAKMEESVRQAQSDSEENARLRELLELQEQRRDLHFTSADITGRSSSNWTSSLTLNKGTADGVAVNNCVVTEEGNLVGVVHDVGMNWCTVLTVLDTDTSLGAQVFRTEDVGLAEGDFTLMHEGLVRLAYLPAGSALLNGDLVVTSGLGGYYPSDLVIGTVQEVRLDDAGATEFAVLSPAADPDTLTQVFLITSFDIVN